MRHKNLFSVAGLIETILLVFIVSILFSFNGINAQAQTDTGQRNPYQKLIAADNVVPLFANYKGVTVGMTADESRAKLGEPASRSDAQDFYIVSDNETAQIFYDKDMRVNAMSISFDGDKAPTCQQILGMDAFKKEDGGLYLIVEYPKYGFWISYSRTASIMPVVTVTMKKI